MWQFLSLPGSREHSVYGGVRDILLYTCTHCEEKKGEKKSGLQEAIFYLASEGIDKYIKELRLTSMRMVDN